MGRCTSFFSKKIRREVPPLFFILLFFNKKIRREVPPLWEEEK